MAMTTTNLRRVLERPGPPAPIRGPNAGLIVRQPRPWAAPPPLAWSVRADPFVLLLAIAAVVFGIGGIILAVAG